MDDKVSAQCAHPQSSVVRSRDDGTTGGASHRDHVVVRPTPTIPSPGAVAGVGCDPRTDADAANNSIHVLDDRTAPRGAGKQGGSTTVCTSGREGRGNYFPLAYLLRRPTATDRPTDREPTRDGDAPDR